MRNLTPNGLQQIDPCGLNLTVLILILNFHSKALTITPFWHERICIFWESLYAMVAAKKRKVDLRGPNLIRLASLPMYSYESIVVCKHFASRSVTFLNPESILESGNSISQWLLSKSFANWSFFSDIKTFQNVALYGGSGRKGVAFILASNQNSWKYCKELQSFRLNT